MHFNHPLVCIEDILFRIPTSVFIIGILVFKGLCVAIHNPFYEQ